MSEYISEYDHYGNSPEFIEIAALAGTDISGFMVVIYGPDGYADHKIPLAGLTVQNTIAGWDVYVIDSTTPGFAGIDSGDSTALIDETGTVLQFITHSSPVTALDGPAAGLTSTDIGSASNTTSSLVSTDGGETYTVQSPTDPGIIPCYAPGTLIDTAKGPRAIEQIQPGDLVKTLDAGPLPVRWVSRRDQPLENIEGEKRPIRIQAGAFGDGCPSQDLIVSPQHRILVGGSGQLEGKFGGERLVPAKALTSLPRIHTMTSAHHITWIHFALDHHHIVCANGCYSESLLLGAMVLQGLNQQERRMLKALWPDTAGARNPLNGPPARECLKVQAARAELNRIHLRPAERDYLPPKTRGDAYLDEANVVRKAFFDFQTQFHEGS